MSYRPIHIYSIFDLHDVIIGIDTLKRTTDTFHKTYSVSGMTCQSCEARVETALKALPEVEAATADKTSATAEIQLRVPVSVGYLQQALGERYKISLPGQPDIQPSAPAASPPQATAIDNLDESRTWLETYRPLLTIVGLIALVTVLARAPFSAGFDGMTWMRHFMAGFFIVFAGFKLLDVVGFSESYSMYDVIAKRWRGWGLMYPFVELGLGLAYLTNVVPFWTNVATILILGVSAIGVIQSVLNKRAIKCACLGTGFNLPMSTVTIIEDVGMVAMAAAMLAVMA